MSTRIHHAAPPIVPGDMSSARQDLNLTELGQPHGLASWVHTGSAEPPEGSSSARSLVLQAVSLHGMPRDQAEARVQALLLSFHQVQLDEKNLRARHPAYGDELLGRTLLALSSLAGQPGTRALLPKGGIDESRRGDPAYQAALAGAARAVELRSVRQVGEAVRGAPVSELEVLEQWVALKQLHVQEATERFARQDTDRQLVGAVTAGVVATAMAYPVVRAAASAETALAATTFGQQLRSVARAQMQSNLGRIGLAGSAASGVSAIHEAWLGCYKNALIDASMSISLFGNGTQLFSKALAGQMRTVGIIGPQNVGLAAKVAEGGAKGLSAAQFASRAAEKVSGDNPLRQLSQFAQQHHQQDATRENVLNMAAIGLSVASIADPRRAALWATAWVAQSLARGQFDAAPNAVSIAGQNGVVKGVLLKHVPDFAEALRASYLTMLLGMKAPPHVRAVLDAASGGALLTQAQAHEAGQAMAGCLSGLPPQASLEALATATPCLRRAGLSPGD